MLKSFKLTLAALGLVLLVHAPAFSATLVFSYSGGSVSCPGGCSLSTDWNLFEPSESYAGVPGFGPRMMRGTWLYVDVYGLPAHTSVSMDFLLAAIDSWDGLTGGYSPDIFDVQVEGTSVFSAGFDIFDYSDQSPVRGTELAWNVPLGFNSWNDAAYDMSSVAALHGIAHSASSLEVAFLFANSQGLDDESFGIDQLKIYVDGAQVPEPSILGLLGLGLARLAATRRRRA
jgi:hypothetical protein